jgi:hypothetical protein
MRTSGKRRYLRGGALAAFVSFLVLSSETRADPVNLGTAGPGNYAVLSIGGGNLALNGPGTTLGNVGVSSPGRLSLDSSNPFAIRGNVYLGDTASITHPAQVQGTISNNQNARLNQAAAVARHASQVADGLAATDSTTSINQNGGNRTITGGIGVNVLHLTGLTLNGGAILTLSAPTGGSFVIDDSGMFNLTGGSKILLTGGLHPTDVLFNVTGTNVQVALNGGEEQGVPKAQIYGVLLVPNSDINFAPGLDTPEIIGGRSINLVSGGEVIDTFQPVPEPASLVLLGIGGAGFTFYRAFVRRPRPVSGTTV